MKQSVMLAQLNEQVEYLRGLLVGLEEWQLAKPPAPGKMSLKQTAVHLGHTNQMFAERVEQMLELHQRISAAKTPQEKTALERQIAC